MGTGQEFEDAETRKLPDIKEFQMQFLLNQFYIMEKDLTIFQVIKNKNESQSTKYLLSLVEDWGKQITPNLFVKNSC